MPSKAGRPPLLLGGLICLLALLISELALSVRQQSQTFDEAYHLLAGYRYWQDADFGINPEHPPLAKLLGSAPLLLQELKLPHIPQGTSKFEGYVAGRQFLYSNDADHLLFQSRMAVSLFTLVLALLLFEVTYRMWGSAPALLALALATFEPNILAHGALLTTDGAVMCLLFAAVYAFYRHLKQPSSLRLVACGFMAGLALAAKHSGVLVFPILASLTLVELLLVRRHGLDPGSHLGRKSEGLPRQARWLAINLFLITAISVVVLWAFYAFRFQARPRNLKMTPPLVDYIRGGATPGVRSPALSRLLRGLEHWRLLPESYIYGLADVAIVSAWPRPSYLFGKLYPHGRWFYFPAVFLIKSTLGLLVLLVLASTAEVIRRQEFRREILFLVVPPAVFFALSLSSGLNIGVRHILPVYPFVLVLAAVGAWDLAKRSRRSLCVVAMLVGLHILSSVRSFPDYLAYSNELWGGPAKTYKVLTNSNVDWGQGLITTKRYLDRHHITDCWMAYFGSADPDYYHIPCKLLPDVFLPWWGKPVDVNPEIVEGTVLIGATQMAGIYMGPEELNPYGKFLKTLPADSIGRSILVFKGRFDMSAASHWGRLNKAWQLLAERHLDQALTEARTAVALDPRMVSAHYTLGYLLAQAKERVAALEEFQTALSLAQSIYPEYQWFWVPFLQAQMSQL